MASKKPVVNSGPKWIQFQVIRNTGKTFVWRIAAKDHGPTMLGDIKWFGRWRRYAFFPLSDTVYEHECLRDIANFCEEQTSLHRQQRRSV